MSNAKKKHRFAVISATKPRRRESTAIARGTAERQKLHVGLEVRDGRRPSLARRRDDSKSRRDSTGSAQSTSNLRAHTAQVSRRERQVCAARTVLADTPPSSAQRRRPENEPNRQLGQLQIRESVGKIYRALDAWKRGAWRGLRRRRRACMRTCVALGGAARAARAPLSLTPGTLRANVSATSWTTRQGGRPPRSSRPSRAPKRRRLLLAEPAPLTHARTALHAKEAC